MEHGPVKLKNPPWPLKAAYRMSSLVRNVAITVCFHEFSSDFVCRLECSPGYVSDLPPTVKCVEGQFEPYRSYQFHCTVATILSISTEGEMEVMSEECNKLLSNIPDMSLDGHSVNAHCFKINKET